MGYEVSFACPVYEGYSMPQAYLRSYMGGATVSQSLYQLLEENNLLSSPGGSRHNSTLQDIKHLLAYCSDDYISDCNLPLIGHSTPTLLFDR
mgnify:FL=1